MPVITTTLHAVAPYDAQPTTHSALKPRRGDKKRKI
jgi:hypothetical protein